MKHPDIAKRWTKKYGSKVKPNARRAIKNKGRD